MADLIALAREWDENGPPHEEYESTGHLINELADRLEWYDDALATAFNQSRWLMKLGDELCYENVGSAAAQQWRMRYSVANTELQKIIRDY